MERINQFSFYDLGRTFLKVHQIQAGTAVTAGFMTFYSAQSAIQQLLAGEPVPLGVSRASAENLLAAIDSLFDRHYHSKDTNGNAVLNFPEETVVFAVWELANIQGLLRTFETVIAEELRDAATYFVPRRGIFHTASLVDSADETFPTDVLPYVPPKSRDEWKAAGRCIAFNILSASGFHVARAVEGMLEIYYQTFCGSPPAAGRSWGHLLTDLEVQTLSPKPAEKTLAEIRQMKDDYRNPLMHPRVVLSEGDARMLFANGESLIIAMAQEMRDIVSTKGGVQPALSLVQGGAGVP